jgi:hypothetical protein
MERYHGLVVYSDKIIELIVEEIEKFSALFEFIKKPQDFS